MKNVPASPWEQIGPGMWRPRKPIDPVAAKALMRERLARTRAAAIARGKVV